MVARLSFNAPPPANARPIMSPLDALLQLQVLDQLPRTGWIQHRVPAPETIGAHAFGTAMVVLALAPAVSPPVETDRAAVLALLHDAGEALTGDIPRSARDLFPPGAKSAAERTAIERLLGPISMLAEERALEALAKESREARFVALCDALQLGVRLVGYVRSGVRGLDDFRAGLERLDCSEFEPCVAFQRELMSALDEAGC
jgi:putative hydrolase of HD superfamily